ncbi:sensor histidine kinase [Aeromicrobium sp. Leaf350]|uniref:sensor histidine kinase n=1 Tax=Aeromicrobium sp. Leaf350 TaxID=2876565 RepID=UPI001E28F969|nr:sensor histidine kinase [Aeromicrobium sp. Leaf350]
MGQLEDMTRSRTAVSATDARWLNALVSDWQLIADLAFSDLVLWVPEAEETGVCAVAQVRPTTGPTALLEDVVGLSLAPGAAPLIEQALTTGLTIEGSTQFVPVRRGSRVVAVVERRREAPGLRSAGALESAYLDVASDLLEMIRTGEFPESADRTAVVDLLRVGDGFVRTEADGTVRFASPNALSAYRRLGLVGDLIGTRLVDVTAGLMDRRTPRHAVPGLLVGAEGGSGELENAAASLHVRRIPLRSAGEPAGALILLRDVTELRSRERELMTKDATIREIHHRVKNNLQTVAALLRLQARRMSTDEARHALQEAERRVGSIALVHETLSQSFGDVVDFDDIADRLLRTVLDVAGEREILATRIGTFGALSGEVATPLSMVLTELIQNAAEHAFGDDGGQITVAVNRIRDRIRLRVSDDGVGMPEGFRTSSSLGLSIVTTLVQTELDGTLTFESRPSGGTTVSITLDA